MNSKEREEFRNNLASAQALCNLLEDLFRYFYYNESSAQRSLWIERIGKELGADETYIKRAQRRQMADHELA